MDQSFKSLACQETPPSLYNPKVRYPVNNSLTLVPVLSQINPVYALPSCYLKIHYHIILPSSLRLPSGLFPSGFATKTLYIFLLPSTCLILLDLITRLIFVKQHGPWRSPLFSVLHSPLTLSLLDPNIFLSTLLSNTLSRTVHIQHYSPWQQAFLQFKQLSISSCT